MSCHCCNHEKILISIFDPITNKKWTTETTFLNIWKSVNYVNVILRDVLGDIHTPTEWQNKYFENYIFILYNPLQVSEILGVYKTITQKIAFMNFISPYFFDIIDNYNRCICSCTCKKPNNNGNGTVNNNILIIKKNKMLLFNSFFRR